MLSHRLLPGAALCTVAALTLVGCGSSAESGDSTASSSASSSTVSIEDNKGTQDVTVPPKTVVATDNRLFETLADWDVQLAAAPKKLIPETISYANDESVVDLGSHREPDLEAIAGVDPDLVVNGQRFAQHYDDIHKLVPDATMLELDPRDDQPLDSELQRQTTAMGEVFGRQEDAKALNEGLDKAEQRAKDAYAGQSTMGLIVSGGDMGYVVPSTGRTIGPLFDMVGLKPALEVSGSEDHQGDDISVEAIAKAKPELLIVMDRDAALKSEKGSTPASEVIEKSEALKDVPAVKNGNVVYLPADTYTNEGIQTYTEILNALADKLEADAKN
ncbi:ABC transporter substrate-binding protein [Kocuria sp. KSNUG]|uniref:siderophore ABC transporter substrate-binding protein n=1 Tax=Kocuria sp. KSNUG TaxID=3136676 RepID=UPI003C2E2796